MGQCCCTYPITIDQGSTFQLQVQYRDSDGLPIDLTDYTAWMQIRQTVESDDFLIELTTEEDGGIEIDGEAGNILITIDSEDTSIFESDFKGVYDLLLISPDGVTTRFLQGTAFVSPTVTHENVVP